MYSKYVKHTCFGEYYINFDESFQVDTTFSIEFNK